MTAWLWTVPALPLASAIALFLLPWSRRWVAVLGAGSVGLAALMTLGIASAFLTAGQSAAFNQTLWSWIPVAGLNIDIGLHLDGLTVVMMGVITGVGFLIHLYSTEYMAFDAGVRRYFAYMNLFVAAMLILVLADNLLLLYLGWEGVGLCSYLLIGFWYDDAANGLAARKAFVVTRIGDTALALGLFLLFAQLGTLEIPLLLERAGETWAAGSPLATAAALLLLGGAVGKSAQVPLQTWLPDAMAGPTPVSALIHAATMVTAGVYLIARLHGLYELAPIAQSVVAIAGAATLLIAGISALAQTEIKRVLAYSTVSQIGYMFLALGVGAWSAGIFHLVTHAFFKALLFLAAGAVMLRTHHEQGVFTLTGLRRRLPLEFWSMLVGGAALAALPLITAGYYSKDAILLAAWSNGAPQIGGGWLWLAGIAGALLTALYTFRMIFLVFFGEPQGEIEPATEPTWKVLLPLGLLGVLSLVGGLIHLPLKGVLPGEGGHEAGRLVEWIAALTPLAGIALAWLWYGDGHSRVPAALTGLKPFALSGCGFDWLYDRLLVRPLIAIGRLNRNDVIDSLFDFIAWINRLLNRGATLGQSGYLRWYAGGISGGALLLLLIIVTQ